MNIQAEYADMTDGSSVLTLHGSEWSLSIVLDHDDPVLIAELAHLVQACRVSEEICNYESLRERFKDRLRHQEISGINIKKFDLSPKKNCA